MASRSPRLVDEQIGEQRFGREDGVGADLLDVPHVSDVRGDVDADVRPLAPPAVVTHAARWSFVPSSTAT